MDRNANRLASTNYEEGADAKTRYSGAHVRRGVRREARARMKAARKRDFCWMARNV